MIPDQASSPVSTTPSTPCKDHHSFEEESSSSQSSMPSTVSNSSRPGPTTPTRKLKGQDLFDASVWRTPQTTRIFYRFIASLRQKLHQEVRETSQTHKFIRTLRDGGRLMRCYTQNIDGLESREALSMDLSHGKGSRKRFTRKIWELPRPAEPRRTDTDGGCEVVPLHGDLENLRCTLCQGTFDWDLDATELFLQGMAPECSRCAAKSEDRQQRGKRGVAVGSLRPNIVLYGENHPLDQLLAPLIPFDVGSGPEILIIMGTSLKVHGLQKIVREFAKRIHARKDGKGRVICVNRTKPAESIWENVIDDYVAMDCDDWVHDLRTRREDLWLRQGELGLEVTKPNLPKPKKRAFTEGPPMGPCKKAKIVVEIPKVPTGRKISSTPWRGISGFEKPNPSNPGSLPTPPPSHGKHSVGIREHRGMTSVDRAPTPECLTPCHHQRDHRCVSKPLHSQKSGNPPHDCFMPPLTGRPSRFLNGSRNTWKSFALTKGANEVNVATPPRPQAFSPIVDGIARRATSRASVRVHRDPTPDESNGLAWQVLPDDSNEEQLPETPTKAVRMLKPLSGTALNSRRQIHTKPEIDHGCMEVKSVNQELESKLSDKGEKCQSKSTSPKKAATKKKNNKRSAFMNTVLN